ncbi:MAG: MFS transporter [Solirubrobacteraceae bacterium]
MTFTAALTALVYGLIRSEPDGWGSTTVAGSLIAAAVLLTVFVVLELRTRAPMLDLGLLRVPTFDGGLIAAWAISASIFSLLTYIVLYLQNVLGASAIQTGLRLLPLTGAIFATAGFAGRLTGRVAIRWLIGPGFVLVGAGLLLMRGLTSGDSWTHLLPGLVVSGVGAGLINVPLASTAVGVVEPARAGMASGINSTLRQVGIATGVAALGSILASQVHNSVLSQVRRGPLAAHGAALAHAINNGAVAQVVANTSVSLRGEVVHVARTAFVDGLNSILLIGAVISFCAAALTIVLIRQRDFVGAQTGQPEPAEAAAAVSG